MTSAIEATKETNNRAAQLRTEAAEQQLEADRIAACRVLAKHPNGLSKTAIGERAGIPTRRWPRVFATMYDLGELVECEIMVGDQETFNRIPIGRRIKCPSLNHHFHCFHPPLPPTMVTKHHSPAYVIGAVVVVLVVNTVLLLERQHERSALPNSNGSRCKGKSLQG